MVQMLARLRGSITGGRIEAGPSEAHASSDNRVFIVPREIASKLSEAGLVPPPVGQKYDVRQLDGALKTLDISDRIRVKSCLRSLGLVSEGQPVALTRGG